MTKEQLKERIENSKNTSGRSQIWQDVDLMRSIEKYRNARKAGAAICAAELGLKEYQVHHVRERLKERSEKPKFRPVVIEEKWIRVKLSSHMIVAFDDVNALRAVLGF